MTQPISNRFKLVSCVGLVGKTWIPINDPNFQGYTGIGSQFVAYRC